MSKVELAIKFGSNEITVFKKGLGIVARQSNYVAITKKGKIGAYGDKAKQLVRTKPNHYSIEQPIKGIEIVDEDLAVTLLTEILDKARFDDKCSMRAIVAVPCAMTERKVLELKKVLNKAGVSKVVFVQNAVCVMQNELDIRDDQQCLVVDIGKYITDISVASKYHFECGRDYFIGGGEMDDAVATYIEDNYNVKVTNELAEEIKREVASLYENDTYTTTFEGLNGDEFVNIAIRANEARIAVINVYNKIFDLIKEFIEGLPKETVANIKKNGVIFTGGVSSICGLSEYAYNKLDIPVINMVNPLDAVILGAGKLIGLNDKDYPHINI